MSKENNSNHDDRTKIEVDRKTEMRTKETSKMISEGGLGAREYYDIEKKSKPDNEIKES